MLLDPYAPLVKGRALFGVRDEFERFQEKACRHPACSLARPRAMLVEHRPYDKQIATACLRWQTLVDVSSAAPLLWAQQRHCHREA